LALFASDNDGVEFYEKIILGAPFFLKQNGVRGAQGIKLEEKIEMCKNYETYHLIEEYQNGVLYYNGDKLDLKEYLKGNVIVLERKNENVEFFDLIEFDKSI